MKCGKIISLFLCILISTQIKAQDPGFTQMMVSPMYFNPAFAGILQNFRAGVQWRNDPAAYNSGFIASADMGLPKFNSGLGFVAMTSLQRSGNSVWTNSISATYAYEFKLDETKYLRLGLSGSLIQQMSTDIFVINPGSSQIHQIEQSPNLATGILYYNNWFYAGAACYNLVPNHNNYRLANDEKPTERRFDLQAGGFFHSGEYIINPYLLLTHQGNISQLLPGLNVNRGMFTLGASYRYADPDLNSFNFLAGITKGSFKICYSFDLQYSDARSAPSGAHELSLVLQLNKKYDTSGKPMIAHLRKAF
jgi:type IX secretion system PorP/SprF family membrane protein